MLTKTAPDIKKCMFTVNYELQHVLMKSWYTLPEESDNAKTSRS